MKKRTRTLLLALAAVLFVAALLCGELLSRGSRLGGLVRELAAFGYSVREDDFYIAHTAPDASIRTLLTDVVLDSAIEASLAAGFPSDIDARGYVQLALVALQSKDVITLFLRDGAIELAFVQRPDSKLVYALGTHPRVGE